MPEELEPTELTEEVARTLSDEELSSIQAGDQTVEEVLAAKEASTSEGEGDEPPAGDPPAEGEEPPASTEEPPQIPDFVPDSLKKHYEEKNLDELAKSAGHFQKKLGEYGQYKNILEYWKANPQAHSNYVQSIIDGTEGKKPPVTGEQQPPAQTNELESVLTRLNNGDIDTADALSSIVGVFNKNISGLESSILSKLDERDTGRVKNEIKKANTEAIGKFAESVKDTYQFDEDNLFEFLDMTAKTVLPTGGEGNARHYTQEDLMKSFKINYGEIYESKLTEKIKTDLVKQMEGETTTEEIVPSTLTDQHQNVAAQTDLDKVESTEEAEAIVSGLSDDQLKDLLAKRGMPWPKRF